ncbi:4Fe-4S dicluster domain-containing protein [Xanthomonas sacchari]|uniref:4Fe-4S dicluster domain-containing protein n=1 Tax=Xanthomonas sacchari TaxID=56458 RepID=UPI0035278EF1
MPRDETLPKRGLRRRQRTAQSRPVSETQCKAAPGVFVPVVDPQRCEGKGDCVAVCPFDVFQIGRLPDEQFASMPLLVKLKLWAHGRRTAFTPHADACRACGICVTACPERAITLRRTADGSA